MLEQSYPTILYTRSMVHVFGTTTSSLAGTRDVVADAAVADQMTTTEHSANTAAGDFILRDLMEKKIIRAGFFFTGSASSRLNEKYKGA